MGIDPSEKTSVPNDRRPEGVKRPSVPALDDMLGVPFRVLDDGFVRVIDYLACIIPEAVESVTGGV